MRGFERDGARYVVVVRRDGVAGSGGCIVAIPLWLWTRARWQLDGQHRWSVETTEMNRWGVGGRRILHELHPTKAAARRRADELLAEGRAAASAGPRDER